MYLLAILLPPLAVLIAGKPFQAFVNFLLCFLLWIPAVIHAVFVVSEMKNQERTKLLAEEMSKNNNQVVIQTDEENGDEYDRIAKLAKLKEQGVITEEEFNMKKKQLLNV